MSNADMIAALQTDSERLTARIVSREYTETEIALAGGSLAEAVRGDVARVAANAMRIERLSSGATKE